jgi:putative ABC transport system substrate-binding protein
VSFARREPRHEGASRKTKASSMSGKIFVCLLTTVFLTVASAEAQPKKVQVIGFLAAPSRSFFAARMEGFQQSMRNLGYIEGKNVIIEYRYAEGKPDRLPELAAELINLKVDLIVASGPASQAAKNATKTIPIVFAGVQDPVASRLVDSLARPGGNVTGLSNLAPELGGKRLELLKEVVPKITTVAFLWGGSGPGSPFSGKATQAAAHALGLQLQSMEARDSKDLDTALEAMKKHRVQALLTNPGPLINTHQARIIEFANKNRLPAMYAALESVDAGGLMSYAPNSADQYRRVAIYVDKILKGAKPGDLPVEQPTKFEFVINLKTAKQIGLTIPQKMLARADRVIK